MKRYYVDVYYTDGVLFETFGFTDLETVMNCLDFYNRDPCKFARLREDEIHED